MSDYTRSINHTAKDALSSGDPNKVIRGSEMDSELDAVATAVATKTDKVVPAAASNVATLDGTGNLEDSGVTSTELGILDGATVTTAELNILDGVTSTTAELNILDGVTATTAELNILDGATLDVTELNYVDGVTSSIQTQLDAKAATADLPIGWNLIDSWVPTAVNSKDFTWDESLYSDIRIVIEGVIPATDNSHLYMRLGYNDGVNFFSGTSDYFFHAEAKDPSSPYNMVIPAGAPTNTFIPISCGVVSGVAYIDTQAGVGSAAGEGYSGTVELLGMASPVSTPRICAKFSYEDDLGQHQFGEVNGNVYDNAADTTVFDSARVYWESGNFEVAGKIWVYGLKRA